MIRKITPFLILAIASLIYSIYILITDGQDWGIFIVFTLFIIAVVFFLIDLGLKRWLGNYKKIIITQLTLIFVFAMIYGYQFRTKTLIIPTDFNKEYVTIIYGVENSKDLSISAITLNKRIEIPENGIFLTSSDFNENLRETNIKMDSGIYLNSNKTDKGFIKMTESNFDSNGRNYKFRTWKIQNGFCCSYSTKEIKKYKAELKNEFEKIKASR